MAQSNLLRKEGEIDIIIHVAINHINDYIFMKHVIIIDNLQLS